MPLKVDTTVTIYITGLALCHQFGGNWEVLFLHPKSSGHELEVTVMEKTAATPPDYSKAQKWKIPAGTNFNLSVQGAISPPSPDHRNDDWRDSRDMCWLTHLDELHPPGVKLEQPNPDIPLSYLSIPNSVFYTSKLTPTLFEIIRADGSVYQTRQIGVVIGADIDCNDGGSVSLSWPGLPRSIDLPKTAGVRYDITFDNSCRGCGKNSDFDYYYEILEKTVPDPFRLSNLKTPPAGGIRLMSDEGACNPSTGGRRGGLSFMELYNSSLKVQERAGDSEKAAGGSGQIDGPAVNDRGQSDAS